MNFRPTPKTPYAHKKCIIANTNNSHFFLGFLNYAPYRPVGDKESYRHHPSTLVEFDERDITVSTSWTSRTRTASSTTDGALDGDCTESVAVAYDFNVIAHFR